MIVVKELAISPIKSTALIHPSEVFVTQQGIVEDRRFYIIDEQGNLVTQRQVGTLALVSADYQPDPERLTIGLPNGPKAEGPVELGEEVETRIYRWNAKGRFVLGEWDQLLSDLCGRPLRLVRSEVPGQGIDMFPVSILSEASLEELNRGAGASGGFERSRFRPNLLLTGCTPHQEEDWIDQSLRIGEKLQVSIVERNERCSLTAVNPATGVRDKDTLRAIISYRGEAYLGVYATVEAPGLLRVGDAVEVVDGSESDLRSLGG